LTAQLSKNDDPVSFFAAQPPLFNGGFGQTDRTNSLEATWLSPGDTVCLKIRLGLGQHSSHPTFTWPLSSICYAASISVAPFDFESWIWTDILPNSFPHLMNRINDVGSINTNS
jgi:hypothetical protein